MPSASPILTQIYLPLVQSWLKVYLPLVQSYLKNQFSATHPVVKSMPPIWLVQSGLNYASATHPVVNSAPSTCPVVTKSLGHSSSRDWKCAILTCPVVSQSMLSWLAQSWLKSIVLATHPVVAQSMPFTYPVVTESMPSTCPIVTKSMPSTHPVVTQSMPRHSFVQSWLTKGMPSTCPVVTKSLVSATVPLAARPNGHPDKKEMKPSLNFKQHVKM